MADKYTSRIALVLDREVDDVGAIVAEARRAGDIDRSQPVRGEGEQAQEVHWGGRMQKAVVRQVRDEDDDAPLLRTETYLGSDGPKVGMQRQAQLLQGLARRTPGVTGVRDLSARAERDQAWMNRLAIGAVEREDAIEVLADGEGTLWLRTHGAARFDVPDLELYGLTRGQVDAARDAVRHVHEQLLTGGLAASLALPDGTAIRLVPVLDAWKHLPLDWPGVGRAGVDRGHGLDGPRASLSVRHKPRLGRWKMDLKGVLERL